MKTAGPLSKAATFFLLTAACLLFLVATLKISSLSSKAGFLDLPDAFLKLSKRNLLLVAGVLEMAVGGVIVFAHSPKTKLLSILWLSGLLGVYRIAAGASGEAYCPCLGSLPQLLHLSAKTANLITLGILGYLAIGSALLLGLRWHKGEPSGGLPDIQGT